MGKRRRMRSREGFAPGYNIFRNRLRRMKFSNLQEELWF